MNKLEKKKIKGMEAVNVPRMIQCEIRLLFLITPIIWQVIKRKSFYTKKSMDHWFQMIT